MAPDSSRAVYVISVAAELAGMHPQTLRIYERKGLLDPARTSGGNRRYSEGDIDRLRLIADLTAEGLNLAGVKRVLELQREVDTLRGQLAELRDESAQALDQLRRAQRRDLVPLSQAVEVWRRR